MAENSVGRGKCFICSAVVDLRKNKAQKLYYTCNGGHDPQGKGCNSVVTMGEIRSENLERELRASQTANNDNNNADNDDDKQPTGSNWLLG
ncbi:hypothetical protein PsW64_03830 [Pseudovibrio sp. W64]|uniref:hypothetical protein n=1 Tax=Pseudovibrio sp. W64 TaxID=1735583 RepID=UPI0007AED2E9|nr:hypothetical protein [Pseudovibrio sp. W64]KZK78191.1 hypothetical protein PsW64_03830 [Pseudovibrio sp. W64]